ncbi:hypothetical protein C8F01DRAFT_1078161 [Mycena amicta]|nr:hypothetical protein C8F01DRAFT_1078161 [Mycena amicta]
MVTQIVFSTKFGLFPHDSQEPQPNAENFCKVLVQLPRTVRLDTSHTNLGIAVDSPNTIRYMVPLMAEPEYIIKNVRTENRQNTTGLTAGVAFSATGAAPTVTVNRQHTSGSIRTVETQGVKAPFSVENSIGAPCKVVGKSYQGWDFSYSPRQFEGRPPLNGLTIQMAVGAITSDMVRLSVRSMRKLNKLKDDDSSAPMVSAINRHQLLLWVQTPSGRAPPQGVLVFVNDVVADIKVPKRKWTGIIDVKLADGAAPTAHTAADTQQPDKQTVVLGAALAPSKRWSWLRYIKKYFTKISGPSRQKPALKMPLVTTTTSWNGLDVAWLTPLFPSLDEKLQPCSGQGAAYEYGRIILIHLYLRSFISAARSLPTCQNTGASLKNLLSSFFTHRATAFAAPTAALFGSRNVQLEWLRYPSHDALLLRSQTESMDPAALSKHLGMPHKPSGAALRSQQ